MYVLLFLVVTVLSFILALSFDLGSLGASIIYLLLITIIGLLFFRKKNDVPELPDNDTKRLTD